MFSLLHLVRTRSLLVRVKEYQDVHIFLANVAHIFILRNFNDENGCLRCRKILRTKCYSYKDACFWECYLLQVLVFILLALFFYFYNLLTSLFHSFSRFFLLLFCYFVWFALMIYLEVKVNLHFPTVWLLMSPFVLLAIPLLQLLFYGPSYPS